jgi:hypothetical protein
VNPRTDCAGHRSESIRAFGWIVRDKRLDVVSGHRTSVDKGSHDEAARASWLSITDVCVMYKTSSPRRRSAAKLLSKDEARRIASEHRQAAHYRAL